IVALGHHQAGLFSNNDQLAERLVEAGKAVGEQVWRLPLAESYDREIDSDAADVKNIGGGRAARSIIVAQFVQRFVNEVPRAQLLGRCWPPGPSVMVRAGSPERVEHLTAALWSYEEAAFLPHGSARDGNPAMQPLWLTHHAENPDSASMIVLVDGLEVEDFQ